MEEGRAGKGLVTPIERMKKCRLTNDDGRYVRTVTKNDSILICFFNFIFNLLHIFFNYSKFIPIFPFSWEILKFLPIFPFFGNFFLFKFSYYNSPNGFNFKRLIFKK